ncbi:hemerythrin domain-containing protein [Nocardioides sp.]|uniref:hemerythrin domain-containing protein n=1 Tax=Nocardioides sp. TaxID=35761 RepID=UPI0025D9A865|nr:hemerythrin domain-containing protein [Nocardioides sp.]
MSSSPDVVELLLAQHERIRQLFADLESAQSDAKQAVFDELRRFLAVHETAEELVTHPRARTLPGGNDVVDARLEEETESKKLLAAMDGMSVDEPDFDRQLATLKKAVLDHAAAEERDEFPLLTEGLGERQLTVMAAAVRAAAALAPTHPHPSVGSSMTTNLAAGPLAALVDRTRDAVRAALGGPASS